MNTDLIIVFLRAPEKGKVKTRLAATIGDEKALEVYTRMLEHTIKEVARTDLPREAWFADTLPKQGPGASLGFTMLEQHGEDLGARMSHAFQRAFLSGFRRVVIVGTDCPGLSTGIIHQAFSELDKHDVVIGPTRDGGYYLLGARCVVPDVFRNKNWSSDSVAKDTFHDLDRLGHSYALLPKLIDVDTEADLADVILP
jgi:rSAM/selenodomain-associated transferase 1